MKLEDRKWKEFKINEIFNNVIVKKLSKSPEDLGDIPFVTSTSLNNGVSNFYDINSVIKNVITVSTNGSCFDCFYHDYPIAVSNDVEVLYSDKLNKFNALFICTILKKEKLKWNYGRKPKNGNVFETIIKLPVDNDNQPDWKFMEDYIKEIWGGSLETSIHYTKQYIDFTNWKDFSIGDLFNIKRGKRIVKNIDFFNYKVRDYIYPVVTASTLNNSIDGYYNNYNCIENTIVCGGEASGFFATYQDEKCWVMDRSRIFVPKENIKKYINKYTAIFLVTIFKKEMFKYSYGRSANPKHIANTIIKLPTDKNGNPNWNYMKNFIKNISFSDKI